MMNSALQLERLVMEALRKERKAQGLSQEKLAEKVHMSSAMILFAETGQRHPTFLTLSRIASALGVSLGEIILAAEKEL
jgi:transcriptional regulator with XRE-family HTH domain